MDGAPGYGSLKEEKVPGAGGEPLERAQREQTQRASLRRSATDLIFALAMTASRYF